jgi:pyrimidine deaminase RibD-like protein
VVTGLNALIRRIPCVRRFIKTRIGAVFAALVRSQKLATSTTALYRNQSIENARERAPDRAASLLA